MTRAWLLPISDDKPKDSRLHLVPTEGGPLVKAACGRLINLQFAKDVRGIRRCHYCKTGRNNTGLAPT